MDLLSVIPGNTATIIGRTADDAANVSRVGGMAVVWSIPVKLKILPMQVMFLVKVKQVLDWLWGKLSNRCEQYYR